MADGDSAQWDRKARGPVAESPDATLEHDDPGGHPEPDSPAVPIAAVPMARAAPPRPDGIEAMLAAALGEQAALITHAMDRWFEHLVTTLAQPEAARADPPAAAVQAEAPTPGPPEPVAESPVARFALAERWDGWRHHQAAALRAGGVIELRQDRSTPGVVSDLIEVADIRLLRVVIQSEIEAGRGDPVLHLRVVGPDNACLAADFPLAGPVAECLIYVPQRVRQIRLYLIAYAPRIGHRFKLRDIAIGAIEPEQYYQRRVKGVLPPATAALASIPGRRELLFDCVASLLLQCDVVRVFLNGYPDVPDFLTHPRIEIRRSQGWDDRGDAGKFAWVADRDSPGYRVIADDDLIYPPDFVQKMTEALARHGNTAIAGLHGILLKQPVIEYYNEASRHVFHFASHLRAERTVHVLGTNAVCYHASVLDMRWQDFMFPNMADIFLARHAQRRGIPMIAVARPRNWVRENVAAQPIDTIYAHSAKRTGSRFDTAWIQDSVVKAMPPFTLQPNARRKLVLILMAEDAARFGRTFESWHRSRSIRFDWAVIAVADDAEALAAWQSDHELHVAAGLDAALGLAGTLGGAAVMLAAGDITFRQREWEQAGLAVLESQAGVVVASEDGGALAMLAPGTLRDLGPVGDGATPGDVLGRLVDSGEESGLRARLDLLAAAVGFGPDGTENPNGGQARLVAPPTRPRIDVALPAAALSVNESFARVLVINLDRRPDRLAAVTLRLAAGGIRAERVAAIDGAGARMRAEYRAYRAMPMASAPDVRAVESSAGFFMDHDSQAARVAYLEAGGKGKAIQSAGAWAYLRTWQGILEDALRARTDSILVFDDDVVPHRQSATLFAAVLGALPADWLILQLGTLQHEWDAPWLTWRNRFLYSTNGAAVGSHAVAVRLEAMPFLLEQINRMDLPFDIGALAATCRAFSDRCFVAYPNIAIQNMADSDINTSKFQKARGLAELARTYRWKLDDYDFGAVTPKRRRR